MHLDKYSLQSGEQLQVFEFTSTGVKGNIKKLVQYTPTNYKDLYNLGFGDKRLKHGGGDAGHKGVRSISQHLGNKNFYRIRIGVGRPREKEDVSSFVLSNFSKTEIDRVQPIIKGLCEDFENIIQNKQI